MKIAPLSFIYQRSQIDFAISVAFASVAYLTQNYNIFILSYLVSTVIFFLYQSPNRYLYNP